MTLLINNITELVSKMETIIQENKILSERVLYVEEQLKIIKIVPKDKPNLMTINDITEEYRIV